MSHINHASELIISVVMLVTKHKVEVYSAAWCPWCVKVKEMLKAHKVDFIEKDIEADPKNAEKLVEASNQRGVPVTVIDDKTVVIGFDVPELKKALGL